MPNTWPGGQRHAMHQSDHESWNAGNSPGTRQLCSKCEAETGRCEEDSLDGDDGEPLCEDCYDRHLADVTTHSPGENMKTYVDRVGKEIKEGDILLYDEGPTGVRQLHRVMYGDEGMVGSVFFDMDNGRVTDNDPVGLIYYTRACHGNVCYDSTVLDPFDDCDDVVCAELVKAVFPGSEIARQLIEHTFSGEIGPKELKGAAWVAINLLRVKMSKEGLDEFLAKDFELEELNGRAGVLVFQLHSEVNGFHAAARFMKRLANKAAAAT